MVSPGVEVKPIEGHALLAYRDLYEIWPHLRIEAVLVHAEIARCVAKADEARQNHWLSEMSEELIVVAVVTRKFRCTSTTEGRCTS